MAELRVPVERLPHGQGLPLPAYAVEKREGPDHAPSFTVSVTVGDYDPELAEGRSRQEAEKAAALVMLLKREGPQ